VNDFFTSLRGLPNEEIRGRVQTHTDAHPQTEAEINGSVNRHGSGEPL
jgi:hypothetical protein